MRTSEPTGATSDPLTFPTLAVVALLLPVVLTFCPTQVDASSERQPTQEARVSMMGKQLKRRITEKRSKLEKEHNVANELQIVEARHGSYPYLVGVFCTSVELDGRGSEFRQSLFFVELLANGTYAVTQQGTTQTCVLGWARDAQRLAVTVSRSHNPMVIARVCHFVQEETIPMGRNLN